MVLVCSLLTTGVRMLRREGRSLGNGLSLLAGLGALFLVALLFAALGLDMHRLYVITGVFLLPAAYLRFHFLCFLGYGRLYGRLSVRRRLDYMVVLGFGLVRGDQVPPLPASRLDRARTLRDQQTERHGRGPVLITSGGQGPDEDHAEAHAMAQYLIEPWASSHDILRECASRTTEQNLHYSHVIMERVTAGYRCAIVTSNFHSLRAGVLPRRVGVRGHALGAPTARYFLPSAMLREPAWSGARSIPMAYAAPCSWPSTCAWCRDRAARSTRTAGSAPEVPHDRRRAARQLLPLSSGSRQSPDLGSRAHHSTRRRPDRFTRARRSLGPLRRTGGRRGVRSPRGCAAWGVGA